MSIKVLTVEPSAWNADDIHNAMLLGEFDDETEALTEIWRDLVQKKQYRAYLMFRNRSGIRLWHKAVSATKPLRIVWGGLHEGMTRMYQEPLDQSEEKKAERLLYALNA
jgi:hypothetical protein